MAGFTLIYLCVGEAVSLLDAGLVCSCSSWWIS